MVEVLSQVLSHGGGVVSWWRCCLMVEVLSHGGGVVSWWRCCLMVEVLSHGGGVCRRRTSSGFEMSALLCVKES